MSYLPSSFFNAYVQTALWSSVGPDGDPFDGWATPEDLATDCRESMRADCQLFWDAAAETIDAAIATGEVVFGPDFDAYGRAGHDFWLTRNGHGAGFWDGDWPEPYGRKLSDLAHSFGECNLDAGTDGFVYCS